MISHWRAGVGNRLAHQAFLNMKLLPPPDIVTTFRDAMWRLCHSVVAETLGTFHPICSPGKLCQHTVNK